MSKVEKLARSRYLAGAAGWTQPLATLLWRLSESSRDPAGHVYAWAEQCVRACLVSLADQAGWPPVLPFQLNSYPASNPAWVEATVRAALGCERVPDLAWLLAAMWELTITRSNNISTADVVYTREEFAQKAEQIPAVAAEWELARRAVVTLFWLHGQLFDPQEPLSPAQLGEPIELLLQGAGRPAKLFDQVVWEFRNLTSSGSTDF